MHSRPVWRWLAIFQIFAAGCAAPSRELHDHVSRRISPVEGANEGRTASGSVARAEGNNRGARDDRRNGPADSVTQVSASDPEVETTAPESMIPLSPGYDSSGSIDQDRFHAGQLTLPGAIELSFRSQPRLRVFLESIEQARGHTDIAYAPFLPTL